MQAENCNYPMKRLLLLIIYCYLPFSFLCAQPVVTLITEAQRLEAAMQEKAALAKYKEVLRIQPQHVEVLSICSELCSRIGNREKTKTSRQQYYEAASNYATQALRLLPLDAGANTSMAIAQGRISLEKSGRDKVQAARDIRKYVDVALRSDPRNHKAWHVLGRWHYEISNLNFIERAAIKVLFGGIPKASIGEAIHAYEQARLFSRGFLLNELELAKAC